MGNEIAVQHNFALSEVQIMAAAIAKSGLFGIKTPDQAMALMLIAQAEGRHPATVAQDYDIIQGRPAIKAQVALIRFQQAGGKIEWICRSEGRCEAKFSHPQSGTVPVMWDTDRADQMGYLSKDNWRKQPMIMLQWRVVAEGVRICYPACLSGQYLVEEVQDFDKPDNRKPVETPAVVTTEPAKTHTEPPTKLEPQQGKAAAPEAPDTLQEARDLYHKKMAHVSGLPSDTQSEVKKIVKEQSKGRKFIDLNEGEIRIILSLVDGVLNEAANPHDSGIAAENQVDAENHGDR